MKIIIDRSTQYGAVVYKPVCETAHRLAQLAGTKTLTPQAIQIIRALGYQIELAEPLPLEV